MSTPNKPHHLHRRMTFQKSMRSLVSKGHSKPQENRKTGIVCTIGPASANLETLKELIIAGMNVARLNFSHGDHKYHAETIRLVRQASVELEVLVGILLDTKGPEIRTGMLETNEVKLQEGQELELYCSGDAQEKVNFKGTSSKILVDYSNLPHELRPGSVVKIDDGLITCRVERIKDQSVFVKVLNSASMGQRKGVNLPGTVVNLEALTEKDKEDLRFGVEQGVDFIAASFTRKASDVVAIRKVLGEEGKNIKIISKIENQEGLDNFDAILDEADGIMVARGDLGVEIPIQRVCMCQKTMIRKCNIKGKPVITATQMLESMIVNPRPTRAEATDVSNAVFDGTDCVMLSGETAKGSYPVEAVRTMATICRTAESVIDYESFYTEMVRFTKRPLDKAEAITASSIRAALDLNAPLIIAMTESGSTARFVAKYKPPVPVLVLTSNQQTARQCLVSRSLYPIVMPVQDETQSVSDCFDIIREHDWAKTGDEIVIVSGIVQGVSGGTNMLRVLDFP